MPYSITATDSITGSVITADFTVSNTVIDTSRGKRIKTDSGTYTPMQYYVSKLDPVSISPDPGSTLNIVYGAIELFFSRDDYGVWYLTYEGASPIFM